MASYNQPTHSILLLELVRLKLNYPINQIGSLSFWWVRQRFFAIASLAAKPSAILLRQWDWHAGFSLAVAFKIFCTGWPGS